jgi:hypothetical protein
VPPSDLKAYSKNPRIHAPDQIQKIAESIKAFGFINPLIVDHDRELIAGHGRLAAAKLLGLQRVPVVHLDHLNDAQKKALRIADNRLAELAGWDNDLLAIKLLSLIEMDGDSALNFELEVKGFCFGAIDQTIEATKHGDAPDPDDVFEPTVSRLGDRWLLDEHSIICGDARDDKVHARALDRLSAQVAICDPPYNVKGEGHISREVLPRPLQCAQGIRALKGRVDSIRPVVPIQIICLPVLDARCPLATRAPAACRSRRPREPPWPQSARPEPLPRDLPWSRRLLRASYNRKLK